MKDKEKQTKVFDILDKMEFFRGKERGENYGTISRKKFKTKILPILLKI